MFLSIEAVTKRYGAHVALEDTSLSAERGEILALLGPSGCGKTTLLNLIAGFLTPDAGRISVGGRDLAGVPPEKRDMGMVFQNYALFPHLSVEQNLRFGLEARGVAKHERGERIEDALNRVGLSGYGARFPHALSGGQQQRVALARALVVRPSILLLDEPLSNLDTLLRKDMREELGRILRAAGITAVLVTHDQEEALVIADRVLLMSGGRIEQAGTPEEIYERPRTVFGARFMEATNLIEGTVAGGGMVETVMGPIAVELTDRAVGDKVTIMVRPERIDIGTDGDNQVEGTVLRASYLGTYRRLHVLVAGLELTVDVPVSRGVAVASGSVSLTWRRIDTHLLVA